MGRNAAAKRKMVSPKRALGEAIQKLGPSASHKSLTEFAKKKYGVKFEFRMIIPK